MPQYLDESGELAPEAPQAGYLDESGNLQGEAAGLPTTPRPWYQTPVNVVKAGASMFGDMIGEAAHSLRRGADYAIGRAIQGPGRDAPEPDPMLQKAFESRGVGKAPDASQRLIEGKTTAGQELNPIPDDWWKDKEGTLAHLAAAGSAGSTFVGDLATDPSTYGVWGALAKAKVAGAGLRAAVDAYFAIKMGQAVPPQFEKIAEEYEKTGHWTPTSTNAFVNAVLSGAGAYYGGKGVASEVAPKINEYRKARAEGKKEQGLPEQPADQGYALTDEQRLYDEHANKKLQELDDEAVDALEGAKPELARQQKELKEQQKAEEKAAKDELRKQQLDLRQQRQLAKAKAAEADKAGDLEAKRDALIEADRLRQHHRYLTELHEAQMAEKKGGKETDRLRRDVKYADELQKAQFREKQAREQEAADAEAEAANAPVETEDSARLQAEKEAEQYQADVDAGRAEAEARIRSQYGPGTEPVLPRAARQAQGNKLGGRGQGSGEAQGLPARPAGQAEAQPLVVGETGQRPAVLPEGRDVAGEAQQDQLAGEGPAVEVGAAPRRRELSPHIAKAVVEAVDVFQKSGKTPTRAEIVQELQNQGLRVGRREGGKDNPGAATMATRIQLAADEVERTLGQREPRGAGNLPAPPAPVEAPAEAPKGPTLPAPPSPKSEGTVGDFEIVRKTNGTFDVVDGEGNFHSNHTTRSAALKVAAEQSRGLPFEAANAPSPEGRKARLEEAKKAQTDELAASMRANLEPVEGHQLEPAFEEMAPETVKEARELSAKSPAYKKMIEGSHLAVQFLREEIKGHFPDIESKLSGMFGTVKGGTVLGLARPKSGWFGPNLSSIAERALQTKDPVAAMRAETLAVVTHEFLHAIDSDTAHGNTQSKLSTEAANMVSEKYGLEKVKGAHPTGRLSQEQKFRLLDRLIGKITDPEGRGIGVGTEKGPGGDTFRTEGNFLTNLSDALFPDLSVDEVKELAKIGNEKGLPEPPKGGGEGPALAMAAPQGKPNQSPIKFTKARETLRKGIKAVGDASWVLYITNLVSKPVTVFGNTVNTLGKGTAGSLVDALMSAQPGHRARLKERLQAPENIAGDLADTWKIIYGDSPKLTEKGEQLKALEDFGVEHLNKPTLRTFSQFASDAAQISKGSARVQDKVMHSLNLAGILLERAETAFQIRVSMGPIMKEEGIKNGDYKALLRKASRDSALKERVIDALAQAQGDAQALTYRRGATEFSTPNEFGEMDRNHAAKALAFFNSLSGWKKLLATLGTGQPFPNALLANAFADMVEFAPGINSAPWIGSKRVRRSGEYFDLAEKAGRGELLTKAERERLNDFRSNALPSKEGIRGMAAVGPMVFAMSLLYYLNQDEKKPRPEPGKLPATERDKEGSFYTKSIKGGLGSSMPYFVLGEIAARRLKGWPKIDPEKGKVNPDWASVAGAVLQQHGNEQGGIPEGLKVLSEPGAEGDKARRAFDKVFSDLGKNLVPAYLKGLGREEVQRRPDLPTRGELPVLSAVGRGMASETPGLKEKVQPSYDSYTGEIKKSGGFFPTSSAPYAGTETKVSRLQEFLDSHRSQLPDSGLTPKQTGEPSYDKAMFGYWQERVKEGKIRTRLGYKTVEQLLTEPSFSDREKSEALQKVLLGWSKEAHSAADRAVLGGTAEAPESRENATQRKLEEEEVRKGLGMGGKRSTTPPPAAGRALKKGQKRRLDQTLGLPTRPE